MTTYSKTLLLFSLLSSCMLCAQISVETVKEGNVQVQITGTSSGMYDGSESEMANKLYTIAAEQARSGELENALKTYKKVLKEDPNFVEVYDNMGVLYRKMERYDDAIASYKRSIELYPKGLMAHQNLATVYNLLGDHDRAINEYTKIIEIEPENSEGYFGLANMLMVKGKFKQALPQALHALEIYEETGSPYLSDGYMLVGMIYYYLEDDESAAPYIGQADRMGAPIDAQIKQEILGEGAKSGEEFSLETPEDYRESAALFTQAFEALMEIQHNSDPEYEEQLTTFLFKWSIGCPEPSMTMSEELMPYTQSSPELMIIFLGGWATYAINSKDYENELNGALSGTEQVIRYYKRNRDKLGVDKSVEKLIKMQDKGKLKEFVRNQLN